MSTVPRPLLPKRGETATGWRRPGHLCRLGGRRTALVLAVLTSAATSCTPAVLRYWFGDLEVLAVLKRELEQAMQPIALAAVTQRNETMAPRRSILLGVVCGCPLRTGQDRCEWHGSGTAGEDDVAQLAPSAPLSP